MPRSVTLKESLRTLKSVMGKSAEQLGINWENHRAFGEDTYRFTANAISLASVIKLMEHNRIADVWWHPSAAPPGAAVDAIAVRYRVYVKYKKIATRARKKAT